MPGTPARAPPDTDRSGGSECDRGYVRDLPAGTVASERDLSERSGGPLRCGTAVRLVVAGAGRAA
ncbi:hypothetical protein [Plantactinospora sp. GCM10030261]|uniref:hypothetical protein n=1 Tax=Plantactinospora sp. GCM10030261 TaxID=3273420 RepID=UPI003615C6E3